MTTILHLVTFLLLWWNTLTKGIWEDRGLAYSSMGTVVMMEKSWQQSGKAWHSELGWDLVDHIVIHTHATDREEEIGCGYKTQKPEAPLLQPLQPPQPAPPPGDQVLRCIHPWEAIRIQPTTEIYNTWLTIVCAMFVIWTEGNGCHGLCICWSQGCIEQGEQILHMVDFVR